MQREHCLDRMLCLGMCGQLTEQFNEFASGYAWESGQRNKSLQCAAARLSEQHYQPPRMASTCTCVGPSKSQVTLSLKPSRATANLAGDQGYADCSSITSGNV